MWIPSQTGSRLGACDLLLSPLNNPLREGENALLRGVAIVRFAIKMPHSLLGLRYSLPNDVAA